MRLRGGKSSDNVPRRRQADPDAIGKERQANSNGGAVFRRNRTLVGSLSARVSSANELGGDLQSPRAHVHHLNAHRRRLGSIFVVVLAAAAALTWLLYEFTAEIYVSPTNNGIAIQQDRYQHAINDYLNGHPLERLRTLLNGQALTDYLHQATPEVADVHINGAAGIATSQFDITFRQAIAGWLINDQQYYVDKDGVPFKVNYFEHPTVRIVDESGVPQATGTPIASGRFLYFVGRTVELSRQNGLIVEQAIIPANTTRQIEIRVARHDYPIKLSLDRAVGEQVEDMERAIKYFDDHHATPKYIDVRVSGKAFYQ